MSADSWTEAARIIVAHRPELVPPHVTAELVVSHLAGAMMAWAEYFEASYLALYRARPGRDRDKPVELYDVELYQEALSIAVSIQVATFRDG